MLLEKISEAIKELKQVQFYYNNELRIVNPHTIGLSKKNEIVLRAYQEKKGWRLFVINEISRFEKISTDFEPHFEYKKNDSFFEKILEEI